MNALRRQPPRLLGVFAHPDDETFCAGGTLAKYAHAGADVRVLTFTKGGAGQIRDASVATRTTLTAVRAKELDAAGRELGITETRCLEYPDGGLSDIDSRVLSGVVSHLLDEFDPDVVITFGPDGFTGHPDHVAVGSATTLACSEVRSKTPRRVFYCQSQRNSMLLRNRLAEWVIELANRFKGTQDFVRALWVFSREATALGYASDFVNVEWFPSGFYLIEQGDAAAEMHFLLSGHVEIRREGEDGQVRVIGQSGPGEFIGEVGIATGQPRNAHVVALDDVTTLTFATPTPILTDEPAAHTQHNVARSPATQDSTDQWASMRIDVSEFVGHKVRAVAAHRSQYPIDPNIFPDPMLQEMFGVEYFVPVWHKPELNTSLLEE